MTLKISVSVLALGCLLLCGCLGPRLSYKGEQLKPTTTVTVLQNQEQLKDYRRIGKAMISGKYQDYSYEELVKDLQKKGCAIGADAVYISSYVVRPYGRERLDQQMDNAPNNAWALDDDSDSGWLQLEQEVDYEYGTLGDKLLVPSATATPIYRRVVKAIFLKRK